MCTRELLESIQEDLRQAVYGYETNDNWIRPRKLSEQEKLAKAQQALQSITAILDDMTKPIEDDGMCHGYNVMGDLVCGLEYGHEGLCYDTWYQIHFDRITL